MDDAHQSASAESGAVTLRPIQRLPPEILELIFMDAVPDVPLIGAHPTFCILVRICSTWRFFVMGMPKLWASFTFSLALPSYDGYAYGPPKPDLLAHFLAHVGTCGLTLRTSLGLDGTNDVRSLELFLGVSKQWADLRLYFIRGALVQLNSLRNHLPQLESLRLVEKRALLFSEPGSIIDAFENAPRLRYVVLRGFRFPETIPIPIAQLGLLTIMDISSWPRIPNLHNNPNITNLSLVDDGCESPEFGPLVWRSLRSLSLTKTVRPLAFTTPLSHFTCPELSHLTINNEERYSVSSISSFLLRSGCSLQSLVLANTRFRGTELLQLLPDIASLQSLTLIDLPRNAITDKVLDALARRRYRPSMLPNLTELHIEGSYIFADRALVDVLQSRADEENGIRLRGTSIVLRNREVAAVKIERLRGLAAGGMAVRLVCLDATKAVVRMI
ncbi:hypothetical protein C8R44DRAFT_709981 [Mycena epipterygia]|nr:hypothetical protein C8R44DRAFT_709981 [Mycena epipterygia]